jgi:hypothetical protein
MCASLINSIDHSFSSSERERKRKRVRYVVIVTISEDLFLAANAITGRVTLDVKRMSEKKKRKM